MAEIDDKKPIESVKAALSLFEQIKDQQDCSTINSREEPEKDVGLLMKNLGNCKVQLEIKESAYMQAVVKLDVYQRTLTELSSKFKLSEADRDRYMEELKKSQSFISMLESEYEVVVDQLVDSTDNFERLLQTIDELKHTKEELLRLKAELIAAKESKELAAKAVSVEKEKNKELLAQVSELNKAILESELETIKAEKVRITFFEAVEEELQATTKAVIQSHEQLVQMRMQLRIVEDLRNELLEKTILSDYYQLELIQTKELLTTSMETEISESNERELALQIEIATLKSEIHKNRSRIAAAEAAEARAMSSQIQLALEAEAAKEEAETMKLEMCYGITISIEEYETLIQKSKMADERSSKLDAANSEIGDLKFALEEANRRAEMAEKAKLAVEGQLRRWRDQQKKRREGSEIVEEKSGRRSIGHEKAAAYKHRTVSLQEGKVFNYVPLGKVLNMKF
ncbi:uncharacterized protein A4U43_C08F13870 [Asparagus officinalis]|uniref:WEB family protein At1g12150-like n=1 Tax=Asparagus officinalis TaxID=4686 RepID=UPI00098E0591|nr:WEB family protein At1g12150-like [Asparagus officinalis]ONK60070.1 uncharacterized protein A4U43_C08F13870 [Asparagus officinalis]